jgi:glutathione peroxidase
MLRTATITVSLAALLVLTTFAASPADENRSQSSAEDHAQEKKPVTAENANSPLDFTLDNIDGQPTDLGQFRGKVVMMVNVASRCGFTGQYRDLQALYSKYGDDGFVVLGFPANNFMGQEPGSNAQIKEFCSTKYDVTFPMFSKISVKGDDQAELYKYLTDKEKHGKLGGSIRWNFTKFLLDREGNLVARYESRTKPTHRKVVEVIEAELAKKPAANDDADNTSARPSEDA